MDKNTLHILCGSRTGNARSIATLAYEYALHLGYEAEYHEMHEMDFDILPEMKNLLVAVSTHGEGEPPVQAEDFYQYLMEFSGKLETNYAIVGLGDSSYRYFCQTGKDIDARLETLGGTRRLEVESCDIDFEEQGKDWVKKALDAFVPVLPKSGAPKIEKFVFELKLTDDQAGAYKAELLEKRLLTHADSTKKVLHVSLSLKNSGLEYCPGDAIGVYGTNSRLFIDKLLKTLNFDPATPIETKNGFRMLKECLINDYELTLLTPIVVEKYAELIDNPKLNKLCADKHALKAYTDSHDILDLVMDYPATLSVDAFLAVMRKLSPRLYSVSSSLNAQAEQVDITVKVIENANENRIREGVASSFLWNRLDIGDKVPLTIETIEKFRLPEDNDKPIIMISAGTGIAPFRGFLQEREARKAHGKNWLLFGERNKAWDAFYDDEFEQWKSKGLLTEYSTAYSRDQEKKVYVSDVLEQEGNKLKDWIDQGAIIYVCGSKDRLAQNVRKSLLNVFKSEYKLSEEDAVTMFEKLKAEKQYQEEVY